MSRAGLLTPSLVVNAFHGDFGRSWPFGIRRHWCRQQGLGVVVERLIRVEEEGLSVQLFEAFPSSKWALGLVDC